MFAAIRKYLIAGLLVWLPVLATVLIIKFFVDITENTLTLLPEKYHPAYFLDFYVPGFGIIFALVILLLTGFLTANFLGKKLIGVWDALLAKIPLVRSIHNSVKQVLQTMLSTEGKSFRKVLLIEYPRQGIWSIAFQVGNTFQEVVDHVGEPMVNVFVPTTPNPTSGFLLLVPQSQVKELSLSVDEALKLVISLGVVSPE
jgi:uncharacterized membrane protein